MMAFSVHPVNGLFSVEALCIRWLIQETHLVTVLCVGAMV